MKKISREQRRRALKEKTRNNAKNRNKGFTNKRLVLDLSNYDGGVENFYKPTEGKNRISVIPYIVQNKNNPDGDELGFESYALDVWMHRYVGVANHSFICPEKTYGKKCPICEEIRKIYQDNSINDEECANIVGPLKAKRRCFYNVIDMDNEDKGIRIFEESYNLFEIELREASEVEEDEIITFADLEDGRVIKFRAVEKLFKGKHPYFEYKNISFEEREPIDESIFDEVYPLDQLLVVTSYDEIKAAFLDEDEG
jgi:hypothetical protein